MDGIAFLPIGPEVVLLLGALVVLITEVTLKIGRRIWGPVTAVTLAVAWVLALLQWQRVSDVGPQLHFGLASGDTLRTPMIVLDHFSALAGLAILAVVGVAMIGARDLVATMGTRRAEFVALVLLATAGLHLMAMSANLLMLFIGLETASIALYLIAGFTRERVTAEESALKYFLLGSFASAFFLYGVALSFASIGTTALYGANGVRSFLATNVVVEPGVMLVGVGLLIVGLGFKVSAAPFHQWAPDVYQGAPGGATGFMSAAVKVAGMAALGRVLIGGFPALIDEWAPVVAAVAALSVIVGTVLAIAQDDFKRMLAYSGVAHAGFMLTALVAGPDGIPGLWFYVITYAFQLVGAFTVASIISGPRRGPSPLSAYTGLASRSPAVAAVLALLMLAMGGIPFTAGFVGKFAVFTAAVSAGYTWLVILALVTSVAGLYFYLRVIVLMYFQAPQVAEAPGTMRADPEPTPAAQTVLGIVAAVTVVFGIIPWPLLELVRNALPL